MESLAEDILSGPDYFRCEKNNARIRKAECVEKQEKAREIACEGDRPRGIRMAITSRLHLEKCLKCEQGSAVKKEWEESEWSKNLENPHLEESELSSVKAKRPEPHGKSGVEMEKDHREQKKVCSKCGGDPQPLENFSLSSHGKYGRKATCKECDRKYAKEYWAKKKKKKKGEAGKVENEKEKSKKVSSDDQKPHETKTYTEPASETLEKALCPTQALTRITRDGPDVDSPPAALSRMLQRAALGQALVDLVAAGTNGVLETVDDDPLHRAYRKSLDMVLDLGIECLKKENALNL